MALSNQRTDTEFRIDEFYLFKKLFFTLKPTMMKVKL